MGENQVAAIQLTDEQSSAVDMARKLASTSSHEPLVGALRGVAGSGKTTCLRAVSQAIGEVVVITPTGRAAVRVRDAAGLQASTIHRWLYRPRTSTRNGEVEWVLKEAKDFHRPESGVVVLDEASMVGEELYNDVVAACSLINCNLLIVGDHFQLPPVTKRDALGEETSFSVLSGGFADFEVTLNTVQRQALDSYIIRASVHVRENRLLEAMLELPTISEAEITNEALRTNEKGGVVICYRNKTRHTLNRLIREKKGYGPDLIQGEPLLALKNGKDHGYMNGEILKFDKWDYLSKDFVKYIDWQTKLPNWTRLGRASVDGSFVGLSTQQVMGEIDNTPKELERLCKVNVSQTPFLHANLGYALTAHKMQGDQTDHVLVIIEKGVVNLDHELGRRWTYVSLTRAIKEVTVAWLDHPEALK